ncbi:MAG: ribonuclease III [Verrucomicrobiota bacterium]
MNPLEEHINYKFRNSLFLAEALTHPSLAYETQKPHFDNQRLEFLGDAVLQLVLTDNLYERFPRFAEGRLTKLRSRLVSREALHSYASNISLGQFLMIGKGEEANGGRERPSILADAFEALIGAIYLDSGLDNARCFVLRACADRLDHILEEPGDDNPKGELQEILQALANESPCYKLVSQEGPDHCKTFISAVEWQETVLGQGRGASKKEAEANAALDALQAKLWRAPGEMKPRKSAPTPATAETENRVEETADENAETVANTL